MLIVLCTGGLEQAQLRSKQNKWFDMFYLPGLFQSSAYQYAEVVIIKIEDDPSFCL